jgi:hypothetical protein
MSPAAVALCHVATSDRMACSSALIFNPIVKFRGALVSLSLPSQPIWAAEYDHCKEHGKQHVHGETGKHDDFSFASGYHFEQGNRRHGEMYEVPKRHRPAVDPANEVGLSSQLRALVRIRCLVARLVAVVYFLLLFLLVVGRIELIDWIRHVRLELAPLMQVLGSILHCLHVFAGIAEPARTENEPKDQNKNDPEQQNDHCIRHVHLRAVTCKTTVDEVTVVAQQQQSIPCLKRWLSIAAKYG